MSSNPITSEEQYILTSFLQQEIRALEQAFSTYSLPKYYKGIPIGFSHVNWVKGTTMRDSGGMPVYWVTKNDPNILHQVDSINKAKDKLDLSRYMVLSYANQVDPIYIKSPTYGEVTVTIPDYPEFDSYNGYGNLSTPMNNLVDKLDLEINKIYLFDSNMNKLPYGPFNGVQLANEYMGLPKTQFNAKWVNRMHLLYRPALGITVYLVCNKSAINKPIYIYNIITGEVTHLPSMQSGWKFFKENLGYPHKSTAFKNFLVSDNVFNNHTAYYTDENDRLEVKERMRRSMVRYRRNKKK